MPDLPPPVYKMVELFGMDDWALAPWFRLAGDALDQLAQRHVEDAISFALSNIDQATALQKEAVDCIEAAMSFRSAATVLENGIAEREARRRK